MDFDNRKVYDDTSIIDGLVLNLCSLDQDGRRPGHDKLSGHNVRDDHDN